MRIFCAVETITKQKAHYWIEVKCGIVHNRQDNYSKNIKAGKPSIVQY